MYSRQQYLQKLQQEYLKAKKSEKTKILNEYIKNTLHNRKYVIRQLNSTQLTCNKIRKHRRNPKYGYHLLKPLEELYNIFDCPCGQRLEQIIKVELNRLIDFGEIKINQQDAELLKGMSSATIDRKIKKIIHRKKKGITTTRPGSLLKRQIPIRLTSWDTNKVGYQEIDLVAHCGSNASGAFGYTISIIDIASGWWEGKFIMNKGQKETLEGLKAIRKRTPFHWLGLDSDNGSEFINWHLLQYCKSENIEFTRSRPNHKNDNAYIEQKNWTHVRKIIGYARYDTPEEQQVINGLYKNELGLYKNFFQPIMKLKQKERYNGSLKRRYEKAKTPYQRLLDNTDVSPEIKTILKAVYKKLNPAQLKRTIEVKLDRLKLINQNKSWACSKPLNTSSNMVSEIQDLSKSKKEVLVTC